MDFDWRSSVKLSTCEQCGSHSFSTKDNKLICDYCSTAYSITNSDFSAKNTSIDLNDDVNRLLEKCRKDPNNAKRYASLVLDIDPSNSEATKYM